MAKSKYLALGAFIGASFILALPNFSRAQATSSEANPSAADSGMGGAVEPRSDVPVPANMLRAIAMPVAQGPKLGADEGAGVSRSRPMSMPVAEGPKPDGDELVAVRGLSAMAVPAAQGSRPDSNDEAGGVSRLQAMTMSAAHGKPDSEGVVPVSGLQAIAMPEADSPQPNSNEFVAIAPLQTAMPINQARSSKPLQAVDLSPKPAEGSARMPANRHSPKGVGIRQK